MTHEQVEQKLKKIACKVVNASDLTGIELVAMSRYSGGSTKLIRDKKLWFKQLEAAALLGTLAEVDGPLGWEGCFQAWKQSPDGVKFIKKNGTSRAHR